MVQEALEHINTLEKEDIYRKLAQAGRHRFRSTVTQICKVAAILVAMWKFVRCDWGLLAIADDAVEGIHHTTDLGPVLDLLQVKERW